jgi:hypothetical protein
VYKPVTYVNDSECFDADQNVYTKLDHSSTEIKLLKKHKHSTDVNIVNINLEILWRIVDNYKTLFIWIFGKTCNEYVWTKLSKFSFD